MVLFFEISLFTDIEGLYRSGSLLAHILLKAYEAEVLVALYNL